jgi:hypothetical protein
MIDALAKRLRVRPDAITWILLLAGILRAIGLTWGLPASDGWDDDGVAPRDFLVGVVETFTPGHHTTYPPLHLLLLALATLPISLFKLATAPSFGPAALVSHFTTTATMTSFALVARCISLALSLGTIRAGSLIAKELDGRPAEVATALILTLNMTLTYYGHTTNLDGPYLFWGTVSVLYWIRALKAEGPQDARRALVRAAAFAALSVSTKDQAYALFVLAFPASLALQWLRHRSLPPARYLVFALAIFVGFLLLIDGPLYNPTGFRARLAFLTGPASQDHAFYPKTWAGRNQVLFDIAGHVDRFYPALGFVPLLALGVWRSRTAQHWVPLLVALSFTLAFNMVARRTEHRFEMPQSIFLAPTAGVGAAWAWNALPRLRRPLGLAFAIFALQALFMCIAVDAALLGDPRYAVEAWLMQNGKSGETVELYGNNVYLPRIPTALRAVRVLGINQTPSNPLPGIEDVVAPFEDHDTRKPTYIVVSAFWVERYLREVTPLPAGYMFQPAFLEHADDQESRRYFRTLVAGERNYERVFVGKFESSVFPLVDIHASTSVEVWVYRRKIP